MYSLLIVDDEPLIVEGIRKILAWEEYGIDNCKTMTSPVEALEYIELNGVNILITDIRMPDLDGNELIRRVKAMRPNTRIIVLSGYNDFEYVRTASLLGIENYLLKPVNLGELEKTLYNAIRRIESENLLEKEKHENRRILRENILSLWINGNIEPEVIREKLNFIGVDLSSRIYSAVTIKLLYGETTSKNVAIVRHAEEICQREIIPGTGDVCFCNGQDEVVLVRMTGQTETELHNSRSLEPLARRLYAALGCDVFICVGPAVGSPTLLSDSYNASRTLAACSYYIGFRTCCFAADAVLDASKSDLPVEQCRNLRMFAIMGDLNGAASYISNFIKKADFSRTNYANIFLASIYNLYIEIEMAHAPERSKALALRFTLPAVENIGNGISCLDAINCSIGLLQRIFFSNEQSGSNYVARMKKVAQSRFSEYLSLKTLSDDFGVSPSYLGYLFIQETSESFSSFLNRIRIDKAKLLLKGKTEKISDISRMTGFTTVNYFHAIFKKHTGLSPAEYREQSE